MQLHRLLPILIVALASAATASPTSPDLLIRDASLITLGGVRQLHLEGTFHYEDLVQVAYPFQLVVYTQSGHYARYDLSGATYTGRKPSIGDGIDPVEATLLLRSRGRKAAAGVVSLRPDAIDLRLPEDLPDAPLSVQIFVEDQGRIVFSNALAVSEERLR